MTVKNDVITVSEDTLDLAASVRVLVRNPFHIISKAVESVRGERRVLRVSFPTVEANSRIDIPFKERLCIKFSDDALVIFVFF
jgi:hypothetical protein